MSNQQHIVQKLTVEIGLDSRDEAFGLQTKITNDYQRLLLNSMSEVFDRLVQPHEFLSIDKLEVDLGKIAINDLEFELSEKIKREVEEALVRLLFEARSATDGNAAVNFIGEDGNTITVQANLKDKSVSLFDSLVYYLEYGLLPWGSNKKEKPGLRFLLGEAMISYPSGLRDALMQFQHQPHIFRRLALQVKDDQLQYLAAIAGCGFSAELNTLFHKILVFAGIAQEQFMKQHGIFKPVSEKALKVIFWQQVLHYFSPGNKNATTLHESEFLAHILKYVFAELEIDIKRIKHVAVDSDNPLKKAFVQLQEEIPAVKKQAAKNPEDEQPAKPKKKTVEAEEIFPPKIKQELNDSPEAEDGIYIANAGLVLLATYLPGFLRQAGLVSGKEFINEEAQWKAVHLLQWMVYGDRTDKNAAEPEEINEHDLALNKILCGLDISEPLPLEPELSAEEKEEAKTLLKAVIQNWKIISRISIPALQVTFLQKEGKLKREGKNWHLFIARDSGVDIIIDRLPWSISMLKMPWNMGTVYVEW